MMTEEEILVQEIIADINGQSRRDKDATTVVETLYPTVEPKIVANVCGYEFTMTHFLLAVIAFLLLLTLCTK